MSDAQIVLHYLDNFAVQFLGHVHLMAAETLGAVIILDGFLLIVKEVEVPHAAEFVA